MKQFAIALYYLFMASVAGAALPLNYTISPVWGERFHLLALKIELSFEGGSDGVTNFQLPSHFADDHFLYRSISRLRSINSALYFSQDSIHGQAQYAPGTIVKMTYEIAFEDHWQWCKASDGFFEVVGAFLFIVPEAASGYSINFQFKDFPPDWEQKCSFGAGNTINAGYFPDMRWLSSLFAAGSELDGVLRLPNCYKEIADCLGRFWEDTSMQTPMVVTLPLRQSAGVAYRGMYLYRAFLFFIDSSTITEAEVERQFFFHEMTHQWIGGKIRNGGTSGDMEFAWFNEGFTEYLALQAQWYCGYLTDSAWQLRLVRDFESQLAASPFGNAPNSEIIAGFYSNPVLKKIPYYRGAVWAAHLDRCIKKNGKGQNLRKVAIQLAQEFEQKDISLNTHWIYVLERLSIAAGVDLKKEYASFILSGEPLK